MSGWFRAVSEQGVPYYVQPSDRRTSWTHPRLATILLQASQQLGYIQYAAYRTAAKCRHLQRALELEGVGLSAVKAAFAACDLAAANWAETINSKGAADVIAILLSNKKAAYGSKNGPTLAKDSLVSADFIKPGVVVDSEDVQTLVEVTLSAALATLDRRRTGVISVSSLKLWLALLCTGRLSDRYRYIHAELADHNACVPAARLSLLLETAAGVAEVLGERDTFGRHLVAATVASCAPQRLTGVTGMTREEMMGWVLREPQLLVWVSTLYRLTCAQDVVHTAGCSSCGVKPVVGLCYTCLQCLGCYLCQECFFSGASTRGHKPSHPLQEYCGQWNRRQKTRALLQTLWNKLSGGRVRRPCTVPPVIEAAAAQTDDRARADGQKKQHNKNAAVHYNAGRFNEVQSSSEDEDDDEDLLSRTIMDGTVAADPRLDSILGHLESENGRLADDLQRLREVLPTDEAVPLTPQTNITRQLLRLRSLVGKRRRTNLAEAGFGAEPTRPAHLQSTPMPPICQLSPIKSVPPDTACGAAPVGHTVHLGEYDADGETESSEVSWDTLSLSDPPEKDTYQSEVIAGEKDAVKNSKLKKLVVKEACYSESTEETTETEHQDEEQTSGSESPEPFCDQHILDLTKYSLSDLTLPEMLPEENEDTARAKPLPKLSGVDAEAALATLEAELAPLEEVACKPPQDWAGPAPSAEVPHQTANELLEMLADLENLCTSVRVAAEQG